MEQPDRDGREPGTQRLRQGRRHQHAAGEVGAEGEDEGPEDERDRDGVERLTVAAQRQQPGEEGHHHDRDPGCRPRGQGPLAAGGSRGTTLGARRRPHRDEDVRRRQQQGEAAERDRELVGTEDEAAAQGHGGQLDGQGDEGERSVDRLRRVRDRTVSARRQRDDREHPEHEAHAQRRAVRRERGAPGLRQARWRACGRGGLVLGVAQCGVGHGPQGREIRALARGIAAGRGSRADVVS